MTNKRSGKFRKNTYAWSIQMVLKQKYVILSINSCLCFALINKTKVPLKWILDYYPLKWRGSSENLYWSIACSSLKLAWVRTLPGAKFPFPSELIIISHFHRIVIFLIQINAYSNSCNMYNDKKWNYWHILIIFRWKWKLRPREDSNPRDFEWVACDAPV